MTRERIDRLVKDGKVVGYQICKHGGIYHRELAMRVERYYTWIASKKHWRLGGESGKTILYDFDIKDTDDKILSEKNNIRDKRKTVLETVEYAWKNIMPEKYKVSNYIPHDRIDQYTGVDVDGAKVFERDVVELQFKESYTNNQICIDEGGVFTGVVRFMDGAFFIGHKDNSGFSLQEVLYNIEAEIKITGIEGVS